MFENQEQQSIEEKRLLFEEENYEYKLSDERCEEIKRIAVELFEKYDVKCIPISSFELAQKMGIKVIPYSSLETTKHEKCFLTSEDGFFAEDYYGNLYIFYNDYKPYGRINNTIMHEIGHVVLGHTEDSDLAEKEVKFFAKFSLAPPVLIHKYKEYCKNAFSVAKVFDISLEAADYAIDYYNKWLRYGGSNYKDYELVILHRFECSYEEIGEYMIIKE